MKAPEVRLKMWYEDSTEKEGGRWTYTGTMSIHKAIKMVDCGLYNQASIVLDEHGFPPYIGGKERS